MKNRNTQLTAVLFVVALALAPIVQAASPPEGGPTEHGPAVTIHITDNVTRGQTGSFVLDMRQSTSSEKGYSTHYPYVNFSVSGTAIPGVDYVAIVSPAYMGRSGYGVILIKTLPDPRGLSSRQAYSVVVTLNPGLGYAVGQPSTATMWIKP